MPNSPNVGKRQQP